MTLYAFNPTVGSNATLPYWTVNVTLKDANNNIVDYGSGISVSFCVVQNNQEFNPFISGDANGFVASISTSLLSALKSWATDADWNTGITWSNYGYTGPVAFDSISIVETGISPITDVTPS